jgi:hypothetical protein
MAFSICYGHDQRRSSEHNNYRCRSIGTSHLRRNGRTDRHNCGKYLISWTRDRIGRNQRARRHPPKLLLVRFVLPGIFSKSATSDDWHLHR